MQKPRTREVLDMNISLLEKRIDGVLNYIENNPTVIPIHMK